MNKQRDKAAEDLFLDVFSSEFGNGKKRGERGLGAKNRELLEKAIRIVEAGKPMNVRGVAYQLFVAGAIPSMAKNETNKISRLLVYAREHHYLGWDTIVDESRQTERPATWDDLSNFAAVIQLSYRRDYWASQPYRVEVWSEKTFGGVLRPILDAYGVPFLIVHGFSSRTVLHAMAEESVSDRRSTVILYVGDHDPSGMWISEKDIPEQIEEYGGRVAIRRLALRAEDLPGLPSFKADKSDEATGKKGDSRYAWYRARYGEDAWELDAMDPNVLRVRVEDAIKEYINPGEWRRMELVEAAEQRTVQRVAAAMAG